MTAEGRIGRAAVGVGGPPPAVDLPRDVDPSAVAAGCMVMTALAQLAPLTTPTDGRNVTTSAGWHGRERLLNRRRVHRPDAVVEWYHGCARRLGNGRIPSSANGLHRAGILHQRQPPVGAEQHRITTARTGGRT